MKCFIFRDASIITSIEKSVTTGKILVLHSIEDEIDPYFFPIIDHINTKSRLHVEEGTKFFSFCSVSLIRHIPSDLFTAANFFERLVFFRQIHFIRV